MGLLLVAFAVGPFSLSAQTIAEQIASLRSQLVTLNDIIDNTPGLTPSEVSQLNTQISTVNTAITNLEAAALNVTTMEVVIDPPSLYAEAQFLDDTGSVMYLDFYFTSAPTTTQDWFDAIVQRTALTLGYSSTTIPSPSSLAANIVQVPAFTGPSVFFPEATTTAAAPTTPFTPSASVASVVTPYRYNAEKVELRGSAKDYEVTARVIFGPETTATTTLAAATSTFYFDFSADATEAEHDYLNRLPELKQLAITELARQTGYSQTFLESIAETSFSTFDNAFDVMYHHVPTGPGLGLVNTIGSFSIIDNIDVISGDEIFSLVLESDQEESLSLTLTPEYSSGGRGSGGTRTGAWDYALNYSIHEYTVDSDSDSGYDAAGIRLWLYDLLEGIGFYMGTPSTTANTSDEVFVNELVNFMLNHSVYYEVDSYYMTRGAPSRESGAATCHDARIQDVLDRTVAFYLDSGMQYAGTVATTTQVRAPIRYRSDDDGGFYSSRCIGTNNSFFPTQP